MRYALISNRIAMAILTFIVSCWVIMNFNHWMSNAGTHLSRTFECWVNKLCWMQVNRDHELISLTRTGSCSFPRQSSFFLEISSGFKSVQSCIWISVCFHMTMREESKWEVINREEGKVRRGRTRDRLFDYSCHIQSRSYHGADELWYRYWWQWNSNLNIL